MKSKGSRLSRRIRAMLAVAPICFLGAMVGGAEARENYALIAAASEYPNLDQKYWLKGPKHDADLVRDYLTSAAPVPFKDENVVTLGSGEGLELASRQNILDELAAIAQKVQPGDFVFLQFSGHGSYQPAGDDLLEADGRDEIFLAADTMMAPKDNPKYMPNVITDNEFGDAFKAIRKAGAFVWLVFDSCHSGTMTRGAPEDDGMVMREIKPSELGIPDEAFTVAAVDSSADRAAPIAAEVFAEPGGEGEGGMVAFFAAQSTEQTPERPYEVTLADGSVVKQNYGVFTHTIFSALAKNPGMTYRQLAQSVLASYAAGNMVKPTPLFEGQLDAPVFGSEDAVNVAQWPTVVGSDGKISISAGQLHGLDRGTKLLVLPSPAASNEEAIGVLEVASSDQLRSKLVPATDERFTTALDVADVPVGAYVRLAEQSFPFELVVAKPDPAGSDPAQLAEVEAALAAILANEEKPLRLRVVEAGEPADVRLAVLSEQQVAELELEADRAAGITSDASPFGHDTTPLLWLLPTSGEISLKPQKRSAGMEIGDSDGGDFASNLSQNLVTIFRATGLSRLSQANTFGPKDFKLSFGVQKAGDETIAELRPEATPVVRPDDRLYVEFQNASGKPVDLNVLYIDHDYGITLLCQSHLANGDRLFQPMADLNETDRGSERIIAVVNESGKDLTDLSFLTQRGIVVRTRGADDTSLVGMLADLGAGEPTRGPVAVSNRDTKQPRGAVVTVPLEVLEATGEVPARDITPVDERQPVGSCTV